MFCCLILSLGGAHCASFVYGLYLLSVHNWAKIVLKLLVSQHFWHFLKKHKGHVVLLLPQKQYSMLILVFALHLIFTHVYQFVSVANSLVMQISTYGDKPCPQCSSFQLKFVGIINFWFILGVDDYLKPTSLVSLWQTIKLNGKRRTLINLKNSTFNLKKTNSNF